MAESGPVYICGLKIDSKLRGENAERGICFVAECESQCRSGASVLPDG